MTVLELTNLLTTILQPLPEHSSIQDYPEHLRLIKKIVDDQYLMVKASNDCRLPGEETRNIKESREHLWKLANYLK